MSYECYLRQIAGTLAESTGCTEPSAIALNAATARKHAKGDIVRVTARLDPYLFKNAMGVGIPGADERGVELCVALGITAGDSEAGMNALHTVTAQQLSNGKALREKVTVEIAEEAQGLYIETIIETDADCVRVITSQAHDNIARVEHAPFAPFTAQAPQAQEAEAIIGDVAAYLDFANNVPAEKLSFLPWEEAEERIDFYSEMISDQMEEGLSEEEAVAKIGSVEDIVSQILSDIPLSKLVKEKIKPKRKMGAWEIIFLIQEPCFTNIYPRTHFIIFSI